MFSLPTDKKLQLIPPFAVLLGHLASLFWFLEVRGDLVHLDHWLWSFVLLLAASMILSVIMIFIKNESALFVFILLKLVVLYLIGYPMGMDLMLEEILLSCLVIEIVIYFSPLVGIPLSAGAILFTLLNQQEASLWGTVYPALPYERLISLAVLPVILVIITGAFRYYRDQEQQKEHSLGRLNRALNQITAVNLDYQDFAADAERVSADKERKRITREIHDIVGYALTNQSMMIEAALILAEKGEAEKLKDLLSHAREQVQVGMSGVREALRALRAVDIPEEPGLKRVLTVARNFESVTGVQVMVHLANMPWTMGIELDRAVVRMIQEGLTNALRHGRATRIHIVFQKLENEVSINIRDNGTGSKTVTEGIGLAGMRERVESYGGSVDADNVVDGFKLCIRIPLPDNGL